MGGDRGRAQPLHELPQEAREAAFALRRAGHQLRHVARGGRRGAQFLWSRVLFSRLRVRVIDGSTNVQMLRKRRDRYRADPQSSGERLERLRPVVQLLHGVPEEHRAGRSARRQSRRAMHLREHSLRIAALCSRLVPASVKHRVSQKDGCENAGATRDTAPLDEAAKRRSPSSSGIRAEEDRRRSVRAIVARGTPRAEPPFGRTTECARAALDYFSARSRSPT